MPTVVRGWPKVRFANEWRGDCDQRIAWCVVEFELDESPVVIQFIKQGAVGRGIRTRHVT